MSTVMKYRKKPVVIEAMQYLGFDESGKEAELFLGDAFRCHAPSSNEIDLMTLEGEVTASQGDWLIRGVAGELYPCRDDIFVATHEQVAA